MAPKFKILKANSPGGLNAWVLMILTSSTFLVYAMEMLTLFQEEHVMITDTVTVLSKWERAL